MGLLWALEHADTHPRTSAACQSKIQSHGHVTTQALTHCLGNSLASAILAYVTPVLIGAVVGALVGLLVASMIRLGRASKPAAVVGITAGRWIHARYAGNCQRCGCSIVPGDRIRHSPGRALCASCGEH